MERKAFHDAVKAVAREHGYDCCRRMANCERSCSALNIAVSCLPGRGGHASGG